MMMGPWFVLVVAFVIAVVWAFQARDDDRGDRSLQVLDRRLAEGDLTVEEHARRRVALREHGQGSRARSGLWRGPVPAVVAVVVAVIVVGWLGMSGWGGGGWMGGPMGWRASTSSTTVVQGAGEVEVEAGELWFDPATVEVTVGEPVNLRLVNTGEVFHDLTVPAADVVLAADAGEQAVGAVEFTGPGRYEFFCSVPGHAQGGMRGTIVVADAD